MKKIGAFIICSACVLCSLMIVWQLLAEQAKVADAALEATKRASSTRLGAVIREAHESILDEREVMYVARKDNIFEAEQFYADKKPWPKGVYGVQEGSTVRYQINVSRGKNRGKLIVREGDWILTPTNNEICICREDIFETIYEELTVHTSKPVQ